MNDDEEIVKLRDELLSELQPEFDALAQQAKDLEQALRDNRFWLGEWLYERHYEYLRLIEEKNDCFLASELGRVEQIDKQLLAARQSIDSYL